MNMTSGVASALRPGSLRPGEDLRCPYLVYRDVLGPDYVAGLLDHVMVHQSKFESRADPLHRNSTHLNDLGAFLAPIESFVSGIAAPALSVLQVCEAKVKPREFFITAYRDGGQIAEHIDTFNRLERLRILSCVYYFGVTPRRFRGGELRLYGLPRVPAVERRPPSSFVDIEPDTDTLVVFPSWVGHEVMPVSVPSGAWLDSRFTINCWMHRAADPPRTLT